MKTEELLLREYKNASDLGSLVKDDPEKLELVMKEKDNIRNEMVKMESVKMELKCKKEEIKAENKRTWITIAKDVGIAVVTLACSGYLAVQTFKFDRESTVTSTLGRGILGNFIPRIK